MAFLIDKNGPIDLSNPDNIDHDKILPEYETRKRILNTARSMGCEREMLMVFAKYDRLARLCKNDSERLDISKLGAFEVYAILGKGGDFVVNGEMVYSEKKS